MQERPFWTKKEKKIRTNEDADKTNWIEQEKKQSPLSWRSDTIRHLAGTNMKKSGFSGTAWADPYPPVPQDWGDNGIISEGKRR